MSHTGGPSLPSPSWRTIVFTFGILVIIVGGGLILYALTPASDRPNELTRIGAAWPAIVSAFAAAYAALYGRRAATALNGGLEDRVLSILETHDANNADKAEAGLSTLDGHKPGPVDSGVTAGIPPAQ